MTATPPVHRIRVPGLHGPVHDWFVIGDWHHTQMHEQGVEHEHHPETEETP